MTWAEFKAAVDKQIEQQGYSGLLIDIEYIDVRHPDNSHPSSEVNVVCHPVGLAVWN